MAKTVTFRDLIAAFLNGDTKGISTTRTLTIRDNQLIHYKTPIVERYGDSYIVNITRYSLATGQLQKQICNTIPEEKQIKVKRVRADYDGSLADYIESR